MQGQKDTATKAAELFADGFHCSQAILCACAGLFREESPPPELVAAMAPFAAGMASSSQVCGALSGALATTGFAWGKTAPKGENHKLMNRIGQEMVKEFVRITAEYGSINCADIAKVDWQDAAAVRQFRTDPNSTRRHCVRVVKETAAALYDLIEKYRNA